MNHHLIWLDKVLIFIPIALLIGYFAALWLNKDIILKSISFNSQNNKQVSEKDKEQQNENNLSSSRLLILITISSSISVFLVSLSYNFYLTKICVNYTTYCNPIDIQSILLITSLGYLPYISNQLKKIRL